ncbi:alpha/beta hydrolase [Nocardia sp. CDC153]|uniref:alpha/beta hydrolase n=1 Tax=Nocardia sp. CDC153 TaxID=3112167 RepID=UPI002DBD8E88|nr:alpha/beta hydrolase [Nocardia sp. CDC153]MEC3954891.1 alpha/beta hydrolase [Nocardia sp. CDC153]
MVSPEMREMIDRLRLRMVDRAAAPPPLDVMREHFTLTGLPPYPMADDVVAQPISDSPVPGFWLDGADARPDRVLLFVHGAGFALGSARSHGELATRIGRAGRARVLFPEYRLAPEHPYPAGPQDVLAIWRWLREDQGVPANSIAVAGDSAGANLLLGLILALRERGEEQPTAAVFLSPALDLSGSGASMVEQDGVDPIFTPAMIHGIFARYLAGTDPRSPAVSPLFADLAGLPPTLVQVGSAEVVLSDSERFAAKADAAGVDVTLEVAPDLPHVYQAMRDTPEAIAATDRIGEFLDRHWQLGSGPSSGPGQRAQGATTGS